MNYKDAEYEVELDGHIVACFKLSPQILEPYPCPTDGPPGTDQAYGRQDFGIGTLLCLDNNGDKKLYVRVTRIVWASPRHECGFVTEGGIHWDDWPIEQELERRTHKSNPIRMGRIFVERVHGVTFEPVTPAGSDDALQTQEEATAGSEGLLRDVRKSNEERGSAQPAPPDTKGTGSGAVGEGADR